MKVAHRQHEAGDFVGAAEALQLFQGLGVGGFGLAVVKDSSSGSRIMPISEYARADEQAASQDQQAPQDANGQVELGHELAVGGEDAQAFLGHGGGDGAEYRQWREQHHVAGHFQHHVGHHVYGVDQQLGAVAQSSHRAAEEHREHHDLQNLVGGHRFKHALGDGVGDEVLHRQRAGLDAAGGVAVRQRQIERHARRAG